MGYRVTVAGSVGVNDVSTFAGIPVYIFISGRAIRNASDPASVAADFKRRSNGPTPSNGDEA